MTVSVLDDQSGVADLENLLEHEECSAGAEEEDEVERKRRKQLAQRWSNLASDSVSTISCRAKHRRNLNMH